MIPVSLPAIGGWPSHTSWLICWPCFCCVAQGVEEVESCLHETFAEHLTTGKPSGCAAVRGPSRTLHRCGVLRRSSAGRESAAVRNPSLTLRLAAVCCAEVVLGTVRDISMAVSWLRTTFMYIRMCRNPLQYR
jgi:hypothetical protein